MVDVTQSDHEQAIGGWKVTQVQIPRTLAATASTVFPIWVAPYRAELGEVAIINSTLVTGHDTNTFNINLINGGQEGAGTTELANIDLRATGTVNLIVGKTLLLDATASGEVFMTQGDILELQIEKLSSGLAANPLLVYIVYRSSNLSS